MMKTWVGIAWIGAAAREWATAFGLEWLISPYVEGLLWTLVLGMHVADGMKTRDSALRLAVLTSGLSLSVLALGMRAEELLYEVPLAYQMSRRAEILSYEWLGIPWVLLLIAVLAAPSAFVLERWLRGAEPGLGRSLAARLLAVLYFGVTLVASVRYGAGELTS
jgi:hypothetical protein